MLKKSIKDLIRQAGELSPSCKEATRLQSEALDHPLHLRQRFGLRVHLLLCKWCRRYGKQISFLHHTVHERPDEVTGAVPHTLSIEAKDRIKQKLRGS